jgi:hypothetical protein
MLNLQIIVTKPYKIGSHNFRVPHSYTKKKESFINIQNKVTPKQNHLKVQNI